MSDAKYTLYYWPMAFRGCFISYQFAYKNEPLTLAGTWESIAAMNAEQPEEQNIPVPALRFCLNTKPEGTSARRPRSFCTPQASWDSLPQILMTPPCV